MNRRGITEQDLSTLSLLLHTPASLCGSAVPYCIVTVLVLPCYSGGTTNRGCYMPTPGQQCNYFIGAAQLLLYYTLYQYRNIRLWRLSFIQLDYQKITICETIQLSLLFELNGNISRLIQDGSSGRPMLWQSFLSDLWWVGDITRWIWTF